VVAALLVVQEVVAVAQTVQVVDKMVDMVGSFAHFVRTVQDSWGIAAVVVAAVLAGSMVALAAD
jgi:hypothetical protein